MCDYKWIFKQALNLDNGTGKMSEIMDGVLIKLWNQGYQVTSITGDAYKMYPAYPNTAFVR